MSIAEKFETIADEVYEKGKKSEYEKFWDDYIYHINNDYTGGFGAFAGGGWTKENCKPNADLKPRYAYQMFGYNTAIEDLDAWCEECGITIDFSKSISFIYTFYGMNNCLKSVGVINTTSANNIGQIFYGALGLHTIKNLILKEDGSQNLPSAFHNCTSLANLTITGKIGYNGFDVKQCPLTHDSLMSIINALYDYSETTTTKAVTFGETNLAKLTDAEKAIATQKGWSLA